MVKTRATLISVAAAIAVGTAFAGQAMADPEQGGVTPSGPSQGGVSPSAPTVQSGVAPRALPDPDPGPGLIPDPPQEVPYRPLPSYDGGIGQTVPPQINNIIERTAPVQPIAAPEGTVRIGTLIEKKPEWLSDRDARSINRWAAYGEAKISQAWRAIGVPDKEADRRAAATILGVAVGGSTGATVLGVPAAILGGGTGAAIGAVTGGIIGASPAFGGAMAGPGALIGAGVGAAIGGAALGVPAALVGAVGGGLLGGAFGQVYGMGDSKADPTQPLLPWQEPQLDDSPKVYRFNIGGGDAQRAGLPSVDYTVNVRGDVRAQIGGNTFTWSNKQANAPYAVLGSGADAARKSVDEWTKQTGDALTRQLPGVGITSGPQANHPASPTKR